VELFRPRPISNGMKQKESLRIVFWGNPEFAVPTLEALAKIKSVSLLAVTNPDKPVGRSQDLTPTPIKTLATKLGIAILEPANLKEPDIAQKLKDFHPDIFIVAAYGKIIPANILSIPQLGALNIHPSLLPLYRGPTPIEHAIANGDSQTGVSIILLDEEMDHGPIVARESAPIETDDDRITLSRRLANDGARLLMKILPQWTSRELEALPQDDTHASYTKRFERDEGRIFWNIPAAVIERRVRAFLGWPDSYALWQRNNDILRLKIEKAHVVLGSAAERSYGATWQSADAAIAVQTTEGSLAIDVLRLEGARSMPAEEFVNGYPDIIGTELL